MLVDALVTTLSLFVIHTFIMFKWKARKREIRPLKFYLLVVFYLSLYIIFVEGLYNFHWFATELSVGKDPYHYEWLIDLFGEFGLKTLESLFMGIYFIVLGFPSFYLGSLILSTRIPLEERRNFLVPTLVFLIAFLIFLIWDFWYSFDIMESRSGCWLWICGEYLRIYSWAVLLIWTAAPLFFYLFGYLLGVSGLRFTRRDLRKAFLLTFSIYFLGLYLWDRGQWPKKVYGNFNNEILVSTIFGNPIYVRNDILMFFSIVFIWISYALAFFSANSLYWKSSRKV